MRINYGYIQQDISTPSKGTQRTANDEGKTFAEIAGRKAVEADKENGSEKTPAILDLIGAQAPDEVRQAWMEAAKGMDGYFTVGGSWVSSDGKRSIPI